MKITSSSYLTQAVAIEGCPNDNIPEFLFLGRSNVGKSSLINALTNNKKLARTSSTPGKTQTLVFLNINNSQLRIVDAPGYGFAKAPLRIRKQFAYMMEDYLVNRTNLKTTYLLLDSRREPNNDDIDMYNYLKEMKKRHIIIITKCDKFSNNKMINIKNKFYKLFPSTTIFFTSSEDKRGIEDISKTFQQYV